MQKGTDTFGFGVRAGDGTFTAYSNPDLGLADTVAGAGSFHLEFASRNLGGDTTDNSNHFVNHGVTKGDQVTLVSNTE